MRRECSKCLFSTKCKSNQIKRTLAGLSTSLSKSTSMKCIHEYNCRGFRMRWKPLVSLKRNRKIDKWKTKESAQFPKEFFRQISPRLPEYTWTRSVEEKNSSWSKAHHIFCPIRWSNVMVKAYAITSEPGSLVYWWCVKSCQINSEFSGATIQPCVAKLTVLQSVNRYWPKA